MATITKQIGIVGIVYKGVFDESTAYNRLNLVKYGNEVFICKVDTQAGVLPTDSTYWDKLIDTVNLNDYYTKNLLYTKDEVDSKIVTYALSYDEENNKFVLEDNNQLKSEVDFKVEQTLTSGVEIATITIGTQQVKLYCNEGGSGGDVPTKLSQLENDVGFVTLEDLPTKTSELENDVGFITLADLPTIATDEDVESIFDQ